jgi:hypothetical protein
MRSDTEIMKVLVELEREFRGDADYHSRQGEVAESCIEEGKADGVVEVMVELFGYQEHQTLRAQVEDLEVGGDGR